VTTVVSMSRTLAALRSFNPVILAFCAVVLGGLLVCALGADFITHYDPNGIAPANRLIPPFRSAAHWLGTDSLGRDIWTRLVYGSRTSLTVGVFATFIGVTVGVVLGVAGGMLRGWFDTFLSWLINVQLSIPAIVLAISISAVLGSGIVNVTVAIAVTLWPQFARLARGTTMTIMQLPFVESAVSIGASRLRIAWKYVLPNIQNTILVLATLEFGHAIVSEAALAFLGFGVEPRRPSWGTMIADGRNYLYLAPWLTLLPAIALSLVTIAVNYLGDELGSAEQS
jgi:peptide/nickel transport system permease protein